LTPGGKGLADYEALAVTLACDPGRLAAVKARLAANRDRTALFDIESFTRQIETAYLAMWDCHTTQVEFRPPFR
jgi:predicted O-linked N-acetylglucosamine transferase (SPINDLY family)